MPLISNGKKGAKMYDADLMRKLGINQIPRQVNENSAVIFGDSFEKQALKKALRVIDEQDAINRYVWYNLPCNLTSQELERLIYYKGNICFFYFEERKQFYFMPYALDGEIDFYARYNTIHPVPMSSGVENKNYSDLKTPEERRQKARYDSQSKLLSQLRLNVVKEVLFEDEITPEVLTNSAVILRDYTNQLSQTNIPRVIINDPIIDMMSDYIPFLGTNLLLGTGITSIRVNEAGEKDEVRAAAQAVYNAALAKNPYVAMTSKVEFQELTGGARNRPEDYLMAFQSLDNFRLSTLGIANGGIFEKKAHVLESENAINYSTVMSAFSDGLKQRQEAANIINSIWGLDIWVEPAEASLGMDIDGDGMAMDNLQEEPPVEGGNIASEGGEE